MGAGWRGPGQPQAGPSGQWGVPTPSHRPLTWHVDHAAVAAPHHGLLLALEAAGGDAVGIVARQRLLPLHAGPAVPPRLRQVGELPGREGHRCRAMPGWVPTGASPGAVGHPALPAAPGRTRRSGSRARHRSPADGCRAARPGCGSGPGCQLQMTSRLREDRRSACLHPPSTCTLGPTTPPVSRLPHSPPAVCPACSAALPPSTPHPCPACAAAPLTGLSPDGQVLFLLDVQHDLQPVAHATLAGHSRVPPVPVEGVALTVACVDLGMEKAGG